MTQSKPKEDSTPGVTVRCEIRWGDMDALGHVNNIVYFQYCESARIAYFEQLNPEQFRTHDREGPGMVAANLNFRRQLAYPGSVDVTASVSSISGKSFKLDYTIREVSTGEVAADGSSVCLWVDYAQAKALPLPQQLVDGIVALENNPELVKPSEG